jgi:hypothetical protein
MKFVNGNLIASVLSFVIPFSFFASLATRSDSLSSTL